MIDLLWLTAWFAVLFGLSVGASLLILSTRERARRRVDIPLFAPLRFRASGGVFRTRLVYADKNEWRLAAPLHRDAYVPLRVGEKLIVEHASAKGIVRFRSEITGRDAGEHTLAICPPSQPMLIERRQSKRLKLVPYAAVEIEGVPGRLVDVSEGGAKVELESGRLSRGERVQILLPDKDHPAPAWVLETGPSSDSRHAGPSARLVFEDPLDLKALKKTKALA
jgi:c-di-GMP-binding flagellar brake protein YcgR